VWPETCTATDGDEIHDFAGFQKDSKSKLGGPIKANGDFISVLSAECGNVEFEFGVVRNRIGIDRHDVAFRREDSRFCLAQP